MKRKLLILSLMLVAVANQLWAQERAVSGKVTTAEDGSGIPGVNILIKGSTSGTVTDLDGNYRISVPQAGAILEFRAIGLTTQEIEVASRSVIDVQMAADVKQLAEVVVTALGTRQNARDVTYANQTVKAEDLLTSPNKNALEALRGKTAGVKITTGSGSVGASSRIVLRGESSLTGNNNALIVVDGMPIDNSSNIGGAQEGEAGYSDFGNRFNDYDPNNIESVTILKGPSATSLYGSRGASGVVLITTKSGAKGKMKINLNSTASVEEAYVLLQRQTRFGQGLISPDGTKSFDSGENFSWGPQYDGVVRPWTSPIDPDNDGVLEYLSRPYSVVENQLNDFFRKGHTISNTLSISGGNDDFSYFSSFSNTSQTGILDNTDYQRNNLVVNTSSKLSNKLQTSFGLNYSHVNQNTASEGSRAFEGQNAYANAIEAPTSVPFDEIRNYNSPFHDFSGYFGSYAVNPFFILNEYINSAKTNNILTNLSLSYTPISDLTLSTKLGLNYVSMDRVNAVPQYEYEDHLFWADDLVLSNRGERQTNAGFFAESLSSSRTIDWTSTANYKRDLSEELTLSATGGLNYYDILRRNVTGQTSGGLVVPGVYNLGNSRERANAQQAHLQRRIIGLLGNVTLGWREKVFLEYSLRNDWSSTLPVNNQSFFYQSLGASAIVSDFFAWDNGTPINYLKIRGSVGTTGKDADVYLLNSAYTVNPTIIEYDEQYQINAPFGGQTGITRNALIGNNTLKPELTTTIEAGADINFLNNRVQLAYTFYKSNSTDQIVEIELPRATGYGSTAVNVGEIQNMGHEVSATLIPVSLANGFKWTMNLTWSKNYSKVIKISDQTDNLIIYDSGRGVSLRAEVGQPFGTWRAQVPVYNGQGQQVVNASGVPIYTEDLETIGTVQPDWIGGAVNTFSFKGLSLGVVLDVRQGGSIFSLTKATTEYNGSSLTTLVNDRMPFIVPNSVIMNPDSTYSPNTNAVVIDSYLDDGNYGKHVLDGSFLKLREITLGYDLPKSVCSRVNLQGISVRLFAKNLKFWLPAENTFADPEVNGPTGPTNATGVESSQTPPSRSYGINLNITL